MGRRKLSKWIFPSEAVSRESAGPRDGEHGGCADHAERGQDRGVGGDVSQEKHPVVAENQRPFQSQVLSLVSLASERKKVKWGDPVRACSRLSLRGLSLVGLASPVAIS